MTAATLAITDFLLARIAEDKRAANDAVVDAMFGSRWKAYPEAAYDEIQSTVLDTSRRVLAECEAKRRIVEALTHPYRHDDGPTGEYASMTLEILARVYADHPDYREEWRA